MGIDVGENWKLVSANHMAKELKKVLEKYGSILTLKKFKAFTKDEIKQ